MARCALLLVLRPVTAGLTAAALARLRQPHTGGVETSAVQSPISPVPRLISPVPRFRQGL
eukprot:gene12406-biopygen3914